MEWNFLLYIFDLSLFVNTSVLFPWNVPWNEGQVMPEESTNNAMDPNEWWNSQKFPMAIRELQFFSEETSVWLLIEFSVCIFGEKITSVTILWERFSHWAAAESYLSGEASSTESISVNASVIRIEKSKMRLIRVEMKTALKRVYHEKFRCQQTSIGTFFSTHVGLRRSGSDVFLTFCAERTFTYTIER